MPEKMYYSLDEAANYTSVAPAELLSLAEAGRLPSYRIPGSTEPYFRRGGLDRLFREEGEGEPNSDPAASDRLTLDQAAAYVGLSRSSLQKLMRLGQLAPVAKAPPLRGGGMGGDLYRHSDLDALFMPEEAGDPAAGGRLILDEVGMPERQYYNPQGASDYSGLSVPTILRRAADSGPRRIPRYRIDGVAGSFFRQHDLEGISTKIKRKSDKRTDAAEGVIQQVIAECIATPQQRTGDDVYRVVLERLNNANSSRQDEDKLPLPSKTTVYRRIKAAGTYRVLLSMRLGQPKPHKSKSAA